MKIDRRVHLVGGGAFGVSHFSDANIYAINCGRSSVLIDAGCGIATEVLAENVEADGLPPLSHILLTHSHWDHARGLGTLKKLTGARGAGHRACDAELSTAMWSETYAVRNGAEPVEPTSLDLYLEDGEALDLGPVSITTVATPGHTGDSLSFILEDKEQGTRALFTGDTVMGEATLGTCTADTDFKGLRDSIQRLTELGVDTLFPGHHAFALRGGRMQLRVLDELMHDHWGGVVGGYIPMLPTWWLQHDQRQITGWALD
ncbi:MAG: MBL fold metallo-hydrolase [Candidatus Dormibacteraeota bacterium]|nr:MBL fold metallo-hydrolase [Candidatus Dormibacteraeota bacterium]